MTKVPLFLTAGLDDAYTGMMRDHEPRHRAYCTKYGYEYLAATRETINAKDGWFRIDLILRALRSDKYSHIFWIDSDAFVADFSVDLRSALPPFAWLGIRVVNCPWAGESWHWQTGVFYIRCGEEALRYFESVRSLEMGSDQDAMMNLLLDAPETQSGLVTLRAQWNVVPHLDSGNVRPIVYGFHGAGANPAQRRVMMRTYAEKYPYEEKTEPPVQMTIGSPNDIANCCLWLDAGEVAQGDVSYWYDRSPRGAVYEASQAHKQENPIRGSDGLIRFTGDAGLSSKTLPWDKGDFTLFLLMNPEEAAIPFCLGINSTAIPPACGVLLGVAGGGRYTFQRSGIGTGLIGQMPLGKLSLLTIVYKAGFVKSFVNGKPSGGITEVKNYYTAQEVATIGSSYWSGKGSHHAKSGAMSMGGIVAYSRALEIFEMAAVEKYIMERWNVR